MRAALLQKMLVFGTSDGKKSHSGALEMRFPES
jgi:hypothetical protein